MKGLVVGIPLGWLGANVVGLLEVHGLRTAGWYIAVGGIWIGLLVAEVLRWAEAWLTSRERVY